MRSLSASLSRIKLSKSGSTAPGTRHPPKAPVLRQPSGRAKGAHQQNIQKRDYYFDTSWHTRKSFLALMNSKNKPAVERESGLKEASIPEHIDTLLLSIRPGLSDDRESKRIFFKLLENHLSSFQAEELNQLRQSLATSGYDCFITEPVIEGNAYREFEMAHGSLYVDQRTLITTPEFHATLNKAAESAHHSQNHLPDLQLSAPQLQNLRDQLAAGALTWRSSDRSITCLNSIATELAAGLGVQIAPDIETSAELGTHASSIIFWRDGLVISREVARALRHPQSDELFARVQRDLLECLLLHKLGASTGQVYTSSSRHRQQVWRLIESIEGLPPTLVLSDIKRQALHAWMNSTGSPGRVQILPTVGAYLGHVSISPHLSVTPDRSKVKQIAGKKYMQGGNQLQPDQSIISEWPIHWLSGEENDEDYPPSEAWQLAVPAERTQLDNAAQEIIRDWKASGTRYRFAEVSPDKPASGCRVSVWAAVRRGMTPFVRDCFDEFNLGLPLPDSPTELWERLTAFKRWLHVLAST